MSADNGYIIRKRWNGPEAKPEFVLQMYNASADDYPPINLAHSSLVFDSLHDAVMAYSKMSNEPGFICEYGLQVKVEDVTMISHPEYSFNEQTSNTDPLCQCQGCGAFASIDMLGKAHNCHKNEDGTYEEGGTFQ